MIDVIVVSYRTNDDLERFIESYRNFAPAECELIAVDVDPLSAFPYTKVPGTLIRTSTNKGYADAVNTAAAMGNGDIIAIFNADVILGEGTIQDCAKALRGNPQWGVVGPMQLDSKGLVTHGGILGTNSAPEQRSWHRRPTPEIREVRDDAVVVIGSAYFIKRSVWQELADCPIFRKCFPDTFGAFLPTFLYYEETGCSYHASAHGYKNVYLGTTECIHEWHTSIKKHGDKNAFKESQAMFRSFCDAHGIEHD